LSKICRKSCVRQSLDERRKQRLYEKGRKKLLVDLDIVKLFRMMEEFSSLKRLLLTPH